MSIDQPIASDIRDGVPGGVLPEVRELPRESGLVAVKVHVLPRAMDEEVLREAARTCSKSKGSWPSSIISAWNSEFKVGFYLNLMRFGQCFPVLDAVLATCRTAAGGQCQYLAPSPSTAAKLRSAGLAMRRRAKTCPQVAVG